MRDCYGFNEMEMCFILRATQSDAAERLHNNSNAFVVCEPVTFCFLSFYGQSG